MFSLFKKKSKAEEPVMKDASISDATGTIYTKGEYLTTSTIPEHKSFYNEKWDFGVYWASASKDGGKKNDADFNAFVEKYNLADYPHIVSGSEEILPIIEGTPCDFVCLYKDVQKMKRVIGLEPFLSGDEALLSSADLYDALYKYNWKQERILDGWSQEDFDTFYNYEEVEDDY